MADVTKKSARDYAVELRHVKAERDRYRELFEAKYSTIRAERDRYREALENMAGDVYIYSLAGDKDGHEIAWDQVMQTQGEAIRALSLEDLRFPQEEE